MTEKDMEIQQLRRELNRLELGCYRAAVELLKNSGISNERLIELILAEQEGRIKIVRPIEQEVSNDNKEDSKAMQ